MYQETCDFPILDEPQRIEWDGHPVTIKKTQIRQSHWGHIVLDLVFTEEVGKAGMPLGQPLYPLEALPPIEAIYNGERLFFELKEFIPLYLEAFFEFGEGYKVSATASPIIPPQKQGMESKWEAFIPSAAFGNANGSSKCYNFDGTAFKSDKIEFTLLNRKWELKCLVQDGQFLTLAEYLSSTDTAIQLSDKGMLLQTEEKGFTFEQFKAACGEIFAVLEFAMGTPLVACVYSKRYPDGSRYPLFPSYSCAHTHGAYGPLRTERYQYCIPTFLQNAYPIYSQDAKWWNITRHWYVHMLSTHEVDAGNFYACLLFDRLYAYLSAMDDSHTGWLQSHPKLTQKHKGKEAIYEGKLTYLAERFKIDFDCKRFKDKRNALVHKGEPDFDYPNNIIQHYEAINLISTIILSLLKYDGDFKHRKRKRQA